MQNARSYHAANSSCAGSPAMERSRACKRIMVGVVTRQSRGNCGGSDRANGSKQRDASARSWRPRVSSSSTRMEGGRACVCEDGRHRRKEHRRDRSLSA